MFPDFSSIRAKEKYLRSLEGERKYDVLNEIREARPIFWKHSSKTLSAKTAIL